MDEKSWLRVLSARSDNRKPVLSPAEGSAIQKRPRGPKWVGILAIAFTFAFSGAVVEAQQPKKVLRIGYLSPVSASGSAASLEAFRQGLREAGYLEGKNITIEYRWAEVSLTGFRSLQPNW